MTGDPLSRLAIHIAVSPSDSPATLMEALVASEEHCVDLEATVAALTAERGELTAVAARVVATWAERKHSQQDFYDALGELEKHLAARAAPRGDAAPDIIHAYGEDDASQPGWAP